MTQTTFEGNAHAIAAWYQPPTRLDEELPEEELCRILGDAYQLTAYAINDNTVIVKTPLGRTLITATTVQGCKIIEFAHNPARTWVLQTFWMNASSVADLSE